MGMVPISATRQVVALMPFLTVDPASRRQRFLRALAAFPRITGAAAGTLGMLPIVVKVDEALQAAGLCVIALVTQMNKRLPDRARVYEYLRAPSLCLLTWCVCVSLQDRQGYVSGAGHPKAATSHVKLRWCERS